MDTHRAESAGATASYVVALAAAMLLAAGGCDSETTGAYGTAHTDDPPAGDADSDQEDLLDWDEDGWTPDGKWGAEGDLDGGGGGPDPYKAVTWECLICENGAGSGADQIPAVDRTVQMMIDIAAERAERRDRIPLPPPDDEQKVLYLSADDSNSQSAATLLREMILTGRIVPGDALRVWELLNYYSFEYAPPAGQSLAIRPQLRPYDIEEGIFALQIGLPGPQITTARRPLNITFSIDTSGSMGGTPIALVRDSLRAIASQLREGDRVSMVDWSTVQTIHLNSYAVTGPDDPDLLEVIDGLSTGGGTDLHSGLVAAYELAEDNFIEGGMNRVVLMSDGGANVGITDHDLIAAQAEGGEDEAIYLVGVGVGDSGYYNDALMDTVTDLGKGASLYINSSTEAHRAFEDNFLANIEMIAHDVQVELTLPPHFDMHEFFGEEYSEEASEVEPQHLAPNDAMVFQQLIKTTEPDQVQASYEIGIRVEWTDALTGEEDHAEGTWTLQELIDADADQLRKADAIVVYAQTLGKIWDAYLMQDEDAALFECAEGYEAIAESADVLADEDLADLVLLLGYYCSSVVPGAI